MRIKPKLEERYYNAVQAVLHDIAELHSRVEDVNTDKPVEEFHFNCYIPGVVSSARLETFVAQMMNYIMGFQVISINIKLIYGNMFSVSAAVVRPSGTIGEPTLYGKVDKI